MDASVEAEIDDDNNVVDGADIVCVVAIEMVGISSGDDVDGSNDLVVVVVVGNGVVVSFGVVVVVVDVVDVCVDVVGVSLVKVIEADSIDLEQNVLGTFFHPQAFLEKKLKMPLKLNILIGKKFTRLGFSKWSI